MGINAFVAYGVQFCTWEWTHSLPTKFLYMGINAFVAYEVILQILRDSQRKRIFLGLTSQNLINVHKRVY